ncbi:glycosyltransferase [Kordiimonas aquimaris]|uniref:glycosyltransferase n=1 Tax=Kordiimonas aquimaris TaxID=707591 RepID=UPI0021D0853E|nr:glycosyltransferase [Kordiimonas aquimaris]
MRILFVHNNFPGQYRRITKYLSQFPEYEMAAASLASNEQKSEWLKVGYKPHREPTEKIHPSLVATERAVIMGQAAYSQFIDMKKKSPSPDIILSHSGWGASLFLKDIFPDAKLMSYFEWYYHCHGGDGEFLRDEPYDANAEMRIRMKNTSILHDLAAMDWGQCPTYFQRSMFPDIFHDRMSVLHDGVDVDYFSPAGENDKTQIKVTDGKTLSADDEVITYVARGMEEYRGFPQFMEAVSKLQKLRPNLHVVVLGNDRVAYGANRKDGKTYKEWALETFELDLTRIHFMGLQPLGYFRDMMRITKAHIYLTVPFVLSWSMMEAMGAGALIIGSDTAPVKEVVTHNENGLIVPFFDVDAQVEQIVHVLENSDAVAHLRDNARKIIVEKYATRDLLPRYRQLIETVANRSQEHREA